jgi:YVTN family beta-propeller protein
VRRAVPGIRCIRRSGAVALLGLAAIGASAPAAGGHGRAVGNLLRNGNGAVGAVSVQGWDSVTIPGWRAVRGLPTVVRAGTRHFPAVPGFRHSSRLFAGGPGGTAILAQDVSLRSARGTLPARPRRYHLSGWLGGTKTSAASLTATFKSVTGRVLGRRTIGPIGGRSQLAKRSASGLLPSGSATASIALRLATSLKNWDGYYAPVVGYDRAVGGRLSFSVSGTVSPPRVASPVAHVPRFDHVFLFMFENQDYRAMIGNIKQAPYFNSLRAHGTLLANLFAEEHPSDANYVAIAAGGAFGIPLTDPLEINPRFSIHARNIGDLVGSAHETWRAYLQSAAGPCDDTVHGYYWNDDLPFLYFPDIRDRPAYCAAHVVPLEAMGADLASARTTPNFAWIAADDCSDMEGCGIHKGDQFLAQTLGPILRSPAWRTQRSLAIITMDEDAYDHEHPPQLVPTLVLGSRGVRQDFVSHTRYTHYSLLRTIEAALGLGTLTRNDRYAQPLNDVFLPHARVGATVAPPASTAVPLRSLGLRTAGLAAFDLRAGTAKAPRATAFVANYQSGTVTPVKLSTHKSDNPIRVGSGPDAIALTPDGRTAYVANSGSGTVTPIDTATRTVGPSIPVGSDPCAIAVSPDGHTAYVVDGDSNAVTPINTVTNQPGSPIPVGAYPRSIALAPDGRTAYVLNWGGGSVTPIDLATGTARAAIPVGSYPVAISFAPDGATAYVANNGSGTVTPFSTATGLAAGAIQVAQAPNALAASPDGAHLMVVSGDTNSVMRIAAEGGRKGRRTRVGYSPEAIALAPRGRTAWVVSTIAGTVTPVSTRSARAGKPVSVGTYSYPTSITFAPGSRTAVVLDTYAGKVSLVNTFTHHASRAITVGGYPDAVAITP